MKQLIIGLILGVVLIAIFVPTSYAQSSYCGGNICDGYHSCGSPITVFGRITYQNGYGVPGMQVVLYDHNRDNSNFPPGAAYTTVVTDANGDYSSNNFVCGEPTINFGDAYAVRPDWNACIQGYSCQNFSLLSIENQQALKPSSNPQLTDCANNSGCNFTVSLNPTGQFTATFEPVSSVSEALTNFAPYAIIGFLVFHIMF